METPGRNHQAERANCKRPSSWGPTQVNHWAINHNWLKLKKLELANGAEMVDSQMGVGKLRNEPVLHIYIYIYQNIRCEHVHLKGSSCQPGDVEIAKQKDHQKVLSESPWFFVQRVACRWERLERRSTTFHEDLGGVDWQTGHLGIARTVHLGITVT